MRRHALALLLSSALAVATPAAVGPLAPAGAEPGPAPATAAQTGTGDGTGDGSGGDPAGLPTVPPAAAERALEVAEEALGVTDVSGGPGAPTAPVTEPEVEPTLALRELFLARASLRGADARRADALLARPTDGRRDSFGDGYSSPTRRTCTTTLCVHYAVSGADAPPGRRWVRKTLDVLRAVQAQQIGSLGYRRPLPDRRRGGDRRFDVYLKELPGGLYGYCAPERVRGRAATAYCVLDDDFSRREFRRAPVTSLRVTAAHEHLHAVQYAYDAFEDSWFFEATATWVEERFADSANDNRQYLPAGQVGTPGERPLDYFGTGTDVDEANTAYGNWAFFELMSQRFRVDVVRRTWERAAAVGRSSGATAFGAVSGQLAAEGTSFDAFYADFVRANLHPGAPDAYSEGAQWYVDAVEDRYIQVGAPEEERLVPLSSQNWTVGPSSLQPESLSVAVHHPSSARSAAAVVLTRVDGAVIDSRVLTADATGRAEVVIDYPAGAEVVVAAVNPSRSTRRGVRVLVTAADLR